MFFCWTSNKSSFIIINTFIENKKMTENSADMIRKYRINKGLSQGALAKQIGVTQAAVGHWERGKFIPRGRNLNALCEALDIPDGLLREDLPLGGRIKQNLEKGTRSVSRVGDKSDQANELVEKIRYAEHQAGKAEFEKSIFAVLSRLSIDAQRHVVIEGAINNQFVVDCITRRSIIEIKHPRSYSLVEQLIIQTLWRMTVLKGLMGDERIYIAIVLRPPPELDFRADREYEKRFSTLLTEAFLVGIRLHIVDTAEEAVKIIEDAELEQE